MIDDKSAGWVKVWRKILDNPIVTKDADHLAVFIHLLLNAANKPFDITLGGERITLRPGQLTTGRKQIAEKYRVSESKVQRILKLFENEHIIEQQTNSRCRLISIVNWHEHQYYEQQTEQQVNSYRTASEQQVNTKQEYKNIKNIEKFNKSYINNNNNTRAREGDPVQAVDNSESEQAPERESMSDYQRRFWAEREVE